MIFLSLKNSACLFSWLSLSSVTLFLTSSCLHRKSYTHQLFDFLQSPLTKLTCSAEQFQSHSIFTSSRYFTSDVGMPASYDQVVKGTWPISFSFREYSSLRTWTQLFFFHKNSLSLSLSLLLLFIRWRRRQQDLLKRPYQTIDKTVYFRRPESLTLYLPTWRIR